jgi:hypothetical protein
MKRFGLVLLVGFFALSLGGCASMNASLQELCGSEARKAAETPAPVQVVQKAPAPEPAKPLPPPPKKDRN